MDIVFIRDLQIDTVIGVFEWERNIRQTLLLDIDMATDIRPAATTDDLAKTLDYKAVSDAVTELVQKSEFQLVETLAETVAGLIQNDFNVPWVKLVVSKPGAVPTAKTVGVMIERGEKRNA